MINTFNTLAEMLIIWGLNHVYRVMPCCVGGGIGMVGAAYPCFSMFASHPEGAKKKKKKKAPN